MNEFDVSALFSRKFALTTWLYGLLWLLLAGSSTAERNVNGGVCKTMSFPTVNVRLNYTCASVVNYEYFLPDGVSDVHLNSEAFTKLVDKRLAILPTSCQIPFKEYVCSSLYLKCLPEGEVDETIYPNYDIAFRRPCSSVCTPVAAKCLGLLKVFGFAPNCTAVTDYSFGNLTSGQKVSQFDRSNNASICNDMSSSPAMVASLREPYLFSETGACSGIVNGDIFVPPGHIANVALAPMQVPFQVQIAIESTLRTTFAALPSTIPAACKYALRKVMCGSSFLKSSMKFFGSAPQLTAPVKGGMTALGVNVPALLAYNMSLPSYPANSVCTSFRTTCAAIIQLMPSLALNCSSKTTNGQWAYPVNNQTVAAVPVKAGANTITLTYSSPPNKMTNAVNNNVVITTPTYGTCVTPEEAFGDNKQQFICSRVVDYEFYLPAGHNVSYLDNQAMAKLNTSSISVLPQLCVKNLMRVVCSMAFRKCPSGIVISNQETWNYNVYSDIGIPIPVPMQRPCKNVCDDVNTHCFGLLTLLQGQRLVCDGARYDYSNGVVSVDPQPYQFDQSNDGTVCNNVSASFEVSAGVERYQYDGSGDDDLSYEDDDADDSTRRQLSSALVNKTALGYCAGVVEEFIVPPASLFDLAPLQEPGIIQSLIEEKLEMNATEVLKVFLTPGCRLAIKKMLCGTSFVHPQPINMRDALTGNNINLTALTAYFESIDVDVTAMLDYTFHIPAFPNRSVCTDFKTQCPSIAARLVNSTSALGAQCSDNDVSPSGFLLFPEKRQLMGRMLLRWNNYTNTYNSNETDSYTHVALYAEPSNMSSSYLAESYEPECPQGYVIPERPLDINVRYVSGTACAISCTRPLIFASSLWDYLYSRKVATPLFAGLILLLILFTCFAQDKHRADHYLIILFSFSCLLNICVAIAMYAKNVQKEGSAWCSTNATPFDPKNDPDNDVNNSGPLCSSQSVIVVYTVLFNCLCWFISVLDVFFKYVIARPKPCYYHTISLIIVFGLPLISVIMQVSGPYYGYQVTGSFCLNHYALGAKGLYLPDLEYFYKPLAVYCFSGILLLLYVIGVWVSRNMGNPCTEVNVDGNGPNEARFQAYEALGEKEMGGSTPAMDDRGFSTTAGGGGGGDVQMQALKQVQGSDNGFMYGSSSPTKNGSVLLASEEGGNKRPQVAPSAIINAHPMAGNPHYVELGKQRATLVFSLLFAIIFALIALQKFRAYDHRRQKLDHMQDKLITLSHCIFALFDGTEESWMPTCGSQIPSAATFLRSTTATRFLVFGQAILLAIIYIPSYICGSCCYYDDGSGGADGRNYRTNQVAIDAAVEIDEEEGGGMSGRDGEGNNYNGNGGNAAISSLTNPNNSPRMKSSIAAADLQAGGGLETMALSALQENGSSSNNNNDNAAPKGNEGELVGVGNTGAVWKKEG